MVEGTVARGQLRDDPLLYTGRSAAAPGAAAAEQSQVRRSVLAPPGSSPALPAAPPAGGQTAGGFSPEFPFPVTREVLERGEERFNIFCAVCHDRAGTGNGMIVQRGYRHPPSYHTDRLRHAPAGYIFDVITNGFGAMPDYASQIPPRDRWAIVAHIRVLQLSQNARLEDLPAEAKRQLQSGGRK
ncbi:MAG: cytochrome c [Acidobacteria bacterium]|nr:cytochrome c [Acidobacteriota bacterium]